jgi:excisionase family DNA binding protein
MCPQYTTNEAAELLGQKPRSIRRAIERGKLTGTMRDGKWYVTADELERYTRERRGPGNWIGHPISEEHREKIRAARLAHHPLRNGPRSAEYRAKLSATKRAQNLVGERAAHWKGGRRMDEAGYIYVYTPAHPSANGTGYVFEHRLVMEQVLGRYLTPEEVVHHINEIRDDNRPENLQVMTHVEHMRLHAELRRLNRETNHDHPNMT